MIISENIAKYKEISPVGSSDHVFFVRHCDTGEIFIKKLLRIYNLGVYESIFEHPVQGVPKILELSEDNGLLTIIEEYIPGMTLEEYIDRGNLLDLFEIKKLILQLCSTLRIFHKMTPPIVNRDIKPSNIILTPNGELFLIDLNSSKLVSESARDTHLLGTEGYAAPEQYGFGSSDVRTDIYAVGIMIKEILDACVDNKTKAYKNLLLIADKCSQLDPQNRFQNIDEVMRGIRHNTTFALGRRWRIIRNMLITVIMSLALATIVFVIVFRASQNDEGKVTSVTIPGTGITIDLEKLKNPNIPRTETFVADYGDAYSIERALEHGEDLQDKYVIFKVKSVHPDSTFGFNMWSGNHLNFISLTELDVKEGDLVSGRVETVDKMFGKYWIMYFTKIDSVITDKTTITKDQFIDEDAEPITGHTLF
ncbi:MAG: serine/threonine protein kinase [Lachnospiraceae bacterium]|nr:serine/threonine protein kinase [Lachnospiraceae bacterium]